MIVQPQGDGLCESQNAYHDKALGAHNDDGLQAWLWLSRRLAQPRDERPD